jgi:cell wall-associated NlpC family hydrolase
MAPGNTIQTGKTKPGVLIVYAKKLLGTPYLYGSADPSRGFDCSGFITYVFKHFNIEVPRSSVDFTNEGGWVALENAKPGDLILFTGTDSTVRRVGHMGIITSNIDGDIQFIHSTSGKARGVVISDMKDYYQSRFVKVIRIFPENNKGIRKRNR